MNHRNIILALMLGVSLVQGTCIIAESVAPEADQAAEGESVATTAPEAVQADTEAVQADTVEGVVTPIVENDGASTLLQSALTGAFAAGSRAKNWCGAKLADATAKALSARTSACNWVVEQPAYKKAGELASSAKVFAQPACDWVQSHPGTVVTAASIAAVLTAALIAKKLYSAATNNDNWVDSDIYLSHNQGTKKQCKYNTSTGEIVIQTSDDVSLNEAFQGLSESSDGWVDSVIYISTTQGQHRKCRLNTNTGTVVVQPS